MEPTTNFFYEYALCQLGRPQEVYRLISESVMPKLSTWVRGQTDERSMRSWQPDEMQPILFPVVNIGHETVVMPCEALVLCGLGSYYNPCDLALLVLVQRPGESLSQLMLRLRQVEAHVRRGPDVTIALGSTGDISLSQGSRDYINRKFLVWPEDLDALQLETLTAQGAALIQPHTRLKF
ncbi:hypothetical protein [Candidatus Cyanaurora vandensis]|uniref:hypothetical protein n=1 Tax=Candidatus Cyanaurora vandensis TaxID=2714958 RepID=UPI00257B42F4|nr:hypothetical protein [Candidatus Cyanaurora vandensis]